MMRKPTFTDIISLAAMLAIITLLILSIEDRYYKSDIVYTTYTVGTDTVKLNVYGEVIR